MDPIFEEFAQGALLSAPDAKAAAVQSGATSGHLPSSSVSKDQQQDFSSSIPPISEENQPVSQKVSKRKQPAASQSRQEKRKKTTSSNRAAASTPSTEPDPLLPAILAFQNGKDIGHGCIVNALESCGMSKSVAEINKLRRCISAISDCIHYAGIHGEISDEAFKKIHAERKWQVKQERIAKLLLVVTKPEDRAVYLKYYHKHKEREKSIIPLVSAPTEEVENSLLAAIRAFQEDKGKTSLDLLMKNHGVDASMVDIIKKHIDVIAECFAFEEKMINRKITKSTLKNICAGRVNEESIRKMLKIARSAREVYLKYLNKQPSRLNTAPSVSPKPPTVSADPLSAPQVARPSPSPETTFPQSPNFAANWSSMMSLYPSLFRNPGSSAGPNPSAASTNPLFFAPQVPRTSLSPATTFPQASQSPSFAANWASVMSYPNLFQGSGNASSVSPKLPALSANPLFSAPQVTQRPSPSPATTIPQSPNFAANWAPVMSYPSPFQGSGNASSAGPKLPAVSPNPLSSALQPVRSYDDEYLPVILEFQKSNGKVDLHHILKKCGFRPSQIGVIRRYLDVIAECVRHKVLYGSIPPEALEKICSSRADRGRINQLLKKTEGCEHIYLKYLE
ncbi:MAG TPA: hypothetical protein VLG76_07125 [Rhabdochlamydiaceae bacterium]|nr:hypothetical protein [Rhabdochlamydiaceae bacterium]